MIGKLVLKIQFGVESRQAQVFFELALADYFEKYSICLGMPMKTPVGQKTN